VHETCLYVLIQYITKSIQYVHYTLHMCDSGSCSKARRCANGALLITFSHIMYVLEIEWKASFPLVVTIVSVPSSRLNHWTADKNGIPIISLALVRSQSGWVKCLWGIPHLTSPWIMEPAPVFPS
jgi:hypothetical protein